VNLKSENEVSLKETIKEMGEKIETRTEDQQYTSAFGFVSR
jgi:hypothetical protein